MKLSGYLLDTNVLSETRKKTPDRMVIAFLERTQPSAMYVSVLSLGELRKGIAAKAATDSFAAGRLAEWADGLEYSFADRILSINTTIGRMWGELCGQRSRPVIDTLLLSTAMHHELTLVTRNLVDVAGTQAVLLNPWSA